MPHGNLGEIFLVLMQIFEFSLKFDYLNFLTYIFAICLVIHNKSYFNNKIP